MENYLPSLKGQFLISMPGLNDPNFFRTVICICDHTNEGAIGITINRIHPSVFAKDIFDELRIKYIPESAYIPIYLGGPVHTNEIFMLHLPPFHWGRCLKITPLLGMSNTRDILEAIAMGKGPESVIIALGCAGWGAGQLESELKQNAWLTCPISNEIIFDIPIEIRWEESVKKIGINPSLLTDTAGHA